MSQPSDRPSKAEASRKLGTTDKSSKTQTSGKFVTTIYPKRTLSGANGRSSVSRTSEKIAPKKH